MRGSLRKAATGGFLFLVVTGFLSGWAVGPAWAATHGKGNQGSGRGDHGHGGDGRGAGHAHSAGVSHQPHGLAIKAGSRQANPGHAKPANPSAPKQRTHAPAGRDVGHTHVSATPDAGQPAPVTITSPTAPAPALADTRSAPAVARLWAAAAPLSPTVIARPGPAAPTGPTVAEAGGRGAAASAHPSGSGSRAATSLYDEPVQLAGGRWPGLSLQAATKLTVPILFGAVVALFVLVQAFIDRRDPKLARAPERGEDDTVGFG